MYYVLGDGGSKYGPADLNTLKQWAAENRVLPNMMLEDANTGAQMLAGSVPGLFGPAPQTPISSPPMTGDQGSYGAGPTDPAAGAGPAPGMEASPHVTGQVQTPQRGSGPYSSPGADPSSPYGQPGPYGQAPGNQPGPYSQNPFSAPYAPPGSGQDMTPWTIGGFLCAPATIFCCLCLFPLGIWAGTKVMKEGDPKIGKWIVGANIAAVIIGLIINILTLSNTMQQIQRLSGGG